MKVYIGPPASAKSGGMYRVLNGLYNHLPIEIVDHPDKADVVHAQINLQASIDPNKPLVVSSHGMLWDNDQWGRIASKVNVECLSAYRLADAVTAPSRFVARSIARYTLADPIVVQHGIDTNEWTPQTSGGYVLWNKARADAASNPLDMNKLAKMARDITFYSTFGQEDTNVTVFGTLPPEDMKEVVSRAGVYLSTAQESGGPCFGVLEALSCGVPVLSWDWGGTAESIVHKETGYLAKLGDYADLEYGLRYCVEHRARLSASARQQAIDQYQWDKVVGGYVQAYQAAIDAVKTPVKVSVIVPCYELEQFLPACLDSVLEQTYKNFEVIVVDDDSPGEAYKIAEEYAKKDKRVSVIKNTINLHVADARNTGIQHAKGQYILPLDADDRLYPNALMGMVAELEADRSLMIAAGKLTVHHEKNLELFAESGWPNGTELKLQLEGYNRLPYASMYRKSLWKRIGGYRRRIRNGTEDADFWTRALSYGYQAKLIDSFTLKYTQRDQSLGKSGGGNTYLDWFPWSHNSSPALATSVKSFDPPKISVIIPVGPHHERFMQTCLDSLIAQTEQDWEAIFVNDTGHSWQHMDGMAMAVLVDTDRNNGVAYARNLGLRVAKANKVVFLDADDVAQPGMLSALDAAHSYAGGWIYGDWHMFDGKDIKESKAKDWSADSIRHKSLAPITGLYEKDHALLVGGFSTDAPGWEDWDFHLKLLKEGICGTRLEYPLITYNMHLGARREDNFADRVNLLQYINNKFPKELTMACSKCGGKRTVVIQNQAEPMANVSAQVELIYIGNEAGTRSWTNTPSRAKYRINSAKSFFALEEDAQYFLQKRDGRGNPLFKEIRKVEPPKPNVKTQATLLSQDILPPATVDMLGLDDKTIGILKTRGVRYVSELEMLPDSELLAIKGVGPQRLTQIKQALAVWK